MVPEDDLKERRFIRDCFALASEYEPQNGTTVPISPEMARRIGDNGDVLDIFFDEERGGWRVVNPKRVGG